MLNRKHSAERCASCERPLDANAKRCACGAATANMSYAERTQYEVEQWRAHRARMQTS